MEREISPLIYIPVAFALCAGLLAPLLVRDKWRRSLVLALRSLWLHKLRAFLSVLGIIIGTCSVISLMAVGEGSMQDALEDIKRLGARTKIGFSVHVHMLRHACGYALANAGHDTRSIQDYLGHKASTARVFRYNTVRYTEPSPTRFKDFWRN